MELDKVIITNLSALKEKYASTMPRVEKAIASLISADKKRGLETRLVRTGGKYNLVVNRA